MSSRFVAVLPPTAGAQLRESHTSLAPQLIIVTTCDPAPADTAARMCVVKVTPPEETKQTEDEVMAAAYGLKFVKRNRLAHGLRRFPCIPSYLQRGRTCSKDMVESAFDGDIDDVKKWLEKGYDLESEDGHKHTAISEAACQVRATHSTPCHAALRHPWW